MAASSDPPQEPEPGAVVDPAVLERRRARREDSSFRAEVERLRAQQALSERRVAEHEAAVALLTGELDRRVAEHAAVASQVARLRGALTTLRERAGVEEAHQDAAAGLLAELRLGQERLGQAFEALQAERDHTQAQLDDERGRREALETLVTRERAGFAARLARADAAARAERVVFARHLEDAGHAIAALEAEVDAAGAAFRQRLADERDRARADASRGARDAVVERLVGELVGTVAVLRASFVAELEALEAERAALPARTGGAAGPEADDVRTRAEGLGAAARSTSSVYDAPTGSASRPSADHPALARSPRPVPAAEPPGVVDDLDRAAARLRAQRAAALEAVDPRPEGELMQGRPPGAPESAVERPPRAPESVPAGSPKPASDPMDESPDGDPGTGSPAADGSRDPAPGQVPEVDAPPASPVAAASAPTTLEPTGAHARVAAPWLGRALVGLAAQDAPAAERVLLAALAVQGARIDEDIAYDIALPLAGRHHVAAVRRGSVVVSASPGRDRPAFRLAGPVAALAPLVAGGSSWRLRGARVRGRRRSLWRLLRALKPAVGLDELHAAGVQLEPYDVLALLCGQVPAGRVSGTRLRVAYVVGAPEAAAVRVIVQARRGEVGPIADAPADAPADATVTVEPQQLLAVLAGAAPAGVAGDHAAVTTLHAWLREVQGSGAS